MPRGNQSSDRTPKPTANASEAQVPEPVPEKHREELELGIKPAGHAETGKDTHKPPAIAIERTQATERAAYAPRPTPKSEA